MVGSDGNRCISEHEERCAVVDARCVAGGRRAIALERRFQFHQRLDRGARLDVFVGVEGDIALPGGLDDWHDLRLETALSNRHCGAPVGVGREDVLFLTGDAPFDHQIFRSDAKWPTPNGSINVATIVSINFISSMRTPLRISVER